MAELDIFVGTLVLKKGLNGTKLCNQNRKTRLSTQK